MSFSAETERLVLRDVREQDLEILIDQSAEPAARDMVLKRQTDRLYIRDHFTTAMIVAGQEPRIQYRLAIALKPDQVLIGNCSLLHAEPEGIHALIGWHFGSDFWGNGYATEVARKLIKIGFETNNVMRIRADCFEHNFRVRRVIEKANMSPVRNDYIRRHLRGFSYGERRAILRYEIWREDWLKC